MGCRRRCLPPQLRRDSGEGGKRLVPASCGTSHGLWQRVRLPQVALEEGDLVWAEGVLRSGSGSRLHRVGVHRCAWVQASAPPRDPRPEAAPASR